MVYVVFGSDATIAPGDAARIKASFLKLAAFPSIFNTGELIAIVQGPINPLRPTVTIFGPSNVVPTWS